MDRILREVSRFEFREYDVHQHYEFKKLLGSGKFGSGWLVVDKKTRVKYVLKSVKYNQKTDYRSTFEAKIAQIVAWKGPGGSSARPCHPNVVCYVDAFYFKANAKDASVKGATKMYGLLMEYFEGYTLKQYMECAWKTGYTLPPKEILVLMRELFKGLSHLYKNGIVHSDIKADNIMCDGKTIKIIDLGEACVLIPPSTAVTPSLPWCNSMIAAGALTMQAPEVSSRKIDYKNPKGASGVDVWAAGATMFYLLFRKEATDPKTRKVIYDPKTDVYPDRAVNSVLQLCMEINPQSRPTAEELVVIIDALLTDYA